MICLFDACISPRIVEALRETDEDIAHHNEHFPEGTLDPELYPKLKERGWILITADDHQHRKPRLKIAINKAKITAVFLCEEFTHRRRAEQLTWIQRWWPKIARKARKAKVGTLLNVRDNGEVREVPAASRITSHKGR